MAMVCVFDYPSHTLQQEQQYYLLSFDRFCIYTDDEISGQGYYCNGGLGYGARIGIGIGIAAAVLILISLCSCWKRR
jgi:hypothetical protein